MTCPDHSFDLARFVAAQDATFATALDEIRRGQKKGHWMWFVFPQIAGLGSSETTKRYAISSLDEARAYLVHPSLGARYRQIVCALQDLEQADPEEVFGPIDAQKLRSSLTLFALASNDTLVTAALNRWFESPDAATIAIIG